MGSQSLHRSFSVATAGQEVICQSRGEEDRPWRGEKRGQAEVLTVRKRDVRSG